MNRGAERYINNIIIYFSYREREEGNINNGIIIYLNARKQRQREKEEEGGKYK